MRRLRLRSARKFWWLLLAAIAFLETNVAMAHSLQRATALRGSIEMLGAVLLALFVIRFRRQIARRIPAMRRARALFRGMASNIRQAALVCEPMHGPGGTVFDFHRAAGRHSRAAVSARRVAHSDLLPSPPAAPTAQSSISQPV